MSKFRSYLAVVLLIVGIGFVTAPSANADICSGAPGCYSDWQTTVYHNAYDYDIDITLSQAVAWHPDDLSRTTYSSGSYCWSTGPHICHRMDEMRLYWAVPGSGVWNLYYSQVPGPNYGDYHIHFITPPSNGSVKGWMAKFNYASFWLNAPIIYN